MRLNPMTKVREPYCATTGFRVRTSAHQNLEGVWEVYGSRRSPSRRRSDGGSRFVQMRTCLTDGMQAKMPIFKTFTTEWAWEVHGQREADCTRTHEEREGRDDPDRNGSKTVM